MKNDRRLIAAIVYMAAGAVLFLLGALERVDSFWSGMGGALLAMGAIRLVQCFRYRRDESYREKQQIEREDERNRFLRNKAWAWAGYVFVMIAAVCTIVFRLLGQELLSMAASLAVCIIVTLYWVCCLILKRKY